MTSWPWRTVTWMGPSIRGWGSVSTPGPREYQPHVSLQAAGWSGTPARTASSGRSSRLRSTAWATGTRRGQRAERSGAGERDDTGALAWGEQQRGVETGPDPVVAYGLVLADLAAEAPQAHAGYAGIGLVVRLEHGGERVGLQHPAVLACTAAQQGCGVAAMSLVVE